MYKGVVFLLLMCVAVFMGCVIYSDQYDEEKDRDVSLTYYDNTIDFSQYSTYE